MIRGSKKEDIIKLRRKKAPDALKSISPTKPFRIIVRNIDQALATVRRGTKWGFEFASYPDLEEAKPFAIIFYPNIDGKRVMRLQADKYMPGTKLLAYTRIRAYPFDVFVKSKLRFKNKNRKRSEKGAPMRATDENNNTFDFEDAIEAVNWLKSRGWDKACRFGIYLCLSKKNNRKTAYGYKWERLKKKIKV